jgi:arsenate reductase (glutaredoxin)
MQALIAWIHPRCSKSRGLLQLLEEAGQQALQREYMNDPPSVAELEAALEMLGESDPRVLIRTKETLYSELGLAEADRAGLLTALAAHPILLERPILFVGERAIIARPPELALPLLLSGDAFRPSSD